MQVAEEAEALAMRGDVAGARRMLEAAANDAMALAALANWHLVGTRVPRDVARGRALLRRAAAIGHVDAALMEVAFTANGSGGDADWAAALALLGTAAKGDPVAAQQLAMIGAMRLTADGQPQAPPNGRPLSEAPEVRLFPALFSPAECAHVAAVAADVMEPSRIVDPVSGAARPDPIRTSDGAVIGPGREDLVVRALNLRIAAASRTPVEHGEPLSVLRYAPGQQYRPHHDALPGAANQRGWTMLVYLNQGYGGGETHFPATGLMVAGRGGDGLLFRNLDDAGAIDPMALHAGLPVTAGKKWLCTRWIRMGPHDPWGEAGV